MADSYLGNSLLKGCDIPHKFTKKEIEEYIKCANDPIYFLENYVQIVHVDEGLMKFKMYDFQKKLISRLDFGQFPLFSRLIRKS